MRFLLPLILLLSAGLAGADRHSELGFEHFYNLEYDEAIREFDLAVQAAPDSPQAHNHLAMGILYRAMFRAGALETEMVTGNNPFLRRAKVEASPAEQQRFDSSLAAAIRLAEAGLQANPKDIEALYALGVAYGFRANYSFLVRKGWRDALRDATTARKYHNKVSELDPKFIDARLVQGLHDYVVGSLSWHWKMLGFLVGFRGNKDEGIRAVETVARYGRRNRVDAEMLLCAIYRRERQAQRAIPLLQDLIQRYPRNYLLLMELAQMHSDLGHKQDALAALDTVERLAHQGKLAQSRALLERVAFAKGNIQFWYGDLGPALENMRRATSASEDLDLNTGVLAWMRLGQIYDLRGERQQALNAYRRAMVFAPDSDAAKESQRYLSEPYRRKRG